MNTATVQSFIRKQKRTQLHKGRIIWLWYALFAFFPGQLTAQEIYAARYTATFTQPPKLVPTPKTPDAPLAGNGDIGLTLGGTPDQLCFYLGKNDFWRAYPVYPLGVLLVPSLFRPGALKKSETAPTTAGTPSTDPAVVLPTAGEAGAPKSPSSTEAAGTLYSKWSAALSK